jgi:tetraacyldisaccharide 4'-kinase
MSLRSKWAALASGRSNRVAGTSYRLAVSPLTASYAAAVGGYKTLCRRGLLTVESVPCKVISVGNLTVGGTGKTPFVAGISNELTSRRIKHCVLCCAYRAGSRSPADLASDGKGYFADWHLVSDEAAMLARKLPGVAVIAAKRHVFGARKAVREFNPDAIILDDGFQSWRLKRDLDIVLLDSSRPFGSGWQFPSGTLRECKTALRRAQVVVFGPRSENEDAGSDSRRELAKRLAGAATILESRIEAKGVWDCRDESELGIEWVRGRKLGLMSGIANPDSFERSVRSLGGKLAFSARYDDHHQYHVFDLRRILAYCAQCGVEAVVTTAKDAVKLGLLLRSALVPRSLRFSVLEIEAALNEPGSFGAIVDRIFPR